MPICEASGAATLDLTGGAPELNTEFRRLVTAARNMGVRVIDRCNLTILEEPGQEDLAQFLAEQQVEVTASLPCYSEDNVDKQRGKGVFDKSIRGLQALNALGYGKPGSSLTLNLVYNPQGPSLPPNQETARGGLPPLPVRQLRRRVQSPVHHHQHADPALRLHADLQRPVRGLHGPPGAVLRADEPRLRHVPLADLGGLERAIVYDCDFNQMLGLPLEQGDSCARTSPT